MMVQRDFARFGILDETVKWQIAMDRMFRVETDQSEAVSPKDVPAFRSLSEAFRIITGRDLSDSAQRVITSGQESILSSTWLNVLGTSMHRRLMKDYGAPAYHEDAISRRRPGGVANFKTQETLQVNYFGDLTEFDTEAQDYPEIAPPGDQKISYQVVQRGNILTVSRKALMNDDLGAVLTMVGRMGRAARRSHAKAIWNLWVNNAVFDVDGVAWFHASHGNLQTTALTADDAGASQIMAAIIKLANQTEPGSGEKLGITRDEPLWLVIPTALIGAALALNVSSQIPNASNFLLANPVFHMFGAENERIIVNSLMTDTNDWGIFRSPDVVESIEVGYLNDQREPEFLVADTPTVGQMFVADKLQYKVRHEYGADIVDFRGAVKAVVA